MLAAVADTARKDNLGFAPIHLGIGARIKGKGHKHLRLPPVPPHLCDIAQNAGTTAPVAFGLNDLIDLHAGVALLYW